MLQFVLQCVAVHCSVCCSVSHTHSIPRRHIIHTCVCVSRLFHTCDIPHSYVCNSQFIHVTCRVHTWDSSHLYMWHASSTYMWHAAFIRETRVIYTCDMPHPHTCDTLYLYKRRASCTRVTWRTPAHPAAHPKTAPVRHQRNLFRVPVTVAEASPACLQTRCCSSPILFVWFVVDKK